jgi:hypothetical protein
MAWMPNSADPETNAKILAIEIDTIRERYKWGGSKVNLFAHSQGGLDARAYLRNLGDKAKDQVKSLTMIATPNHGTVGADWRNLYWKLRLNPKKCTPWLTPGWVERFDANTPLVRGVKYYTVAGSKCVLPGSWIIPGEDDGVVPVKSVHLDGATVLGPSPGERTFPYEHNELLTRKEVQEAIIKVIDPSYSEEPNSLAFVATEDGETLSLDQGVSRSVILIKNGETLSLNQGVSRSVILDDVNEVAFVLISDSTVWTSLLSPDGEMITAHSSNAIVSEHSVVWSDDPELRADSYVVRKPVPGVWMAIVCGYSRPSHFLLLVSAESTFVLDGSTDEYFNPVGGKVRLRATLDADASITDMHAEITDPNGSRESVALYDDGLHEDNSPNDGVYGDVFSPSLEGEYTIVFSAKGTVGGKEFSRADLESIFVSAPTMPAR